MKLPRQGSQGGLSGKGGQGGKGDPGGHCQDSHGVRMVGVGKVVRVVNITISQYEYYFVA